MSSYLFEFPLATAKQLTHIQVRKKLSLLPTHKQFYPLGLYTKPSLIITHIGN